MSKIKIVYLGLIATIGFAVGLGLFVYAFFTRDSPVTLVQFLVIGWFSIMHSLRFAQNHYAQYVSFNVLKKIVGAIYLFCTVVFCIYTFFILQSIPILCVISLCLALQNLVGFLLCLASSRYYFDIQDGKLLQFYEGRRPFKNNYLEAFFLLYGLKYAIIIPNTVTIIGMDAFSKGHNIVAIRIPETVTGIEEDAFYGCGNLRYISVPKTVTSIGAGAFSGCIHLKHIDINSSSQYYFFKKGVLYEKESILHTYLCSNTRKNFTVPSFITEIARKAFFHWQALRTIEISSKVIKIASDAFSEKLKLRRVHVEASNNSFSTDINNSVLYSKNGDVLYENKNKFQFRKQHLFLTIFFVLVGLLLFLFAKYMLSLTWY